MTDQNATLVRYGGSWSSKGQIRKMEASEALAWLSKNKYTARRARDLRDKDTMEIIGRQIDYRKDGCNTEYTLTVKF